MTSHVLSLTEEHVTRKLAHSLAQNGHEIVAVHPPDGQGPFVIPKPKVKTDIERSSFHPDVVSMAKDSNGKLFLYISECKLSESDLKSDRIKLSTFASDKDSLLYALFRCQKFPEGPENGFDFEQVSSLATSDLPIRFILAAGANREILDVADTNIGDFKCRKYLFDFKRLLSL
jgi:hypothetical protein